MTWVRRYELFTARTIRTSMKIKDTAEFSFSLRHRLGSFFRGYRPYVILTDRNTPGSVEWWSVFFENWFCCGAGCRKLTIKRDKWKPAFISEKFRRRNSAIVQKLKCVVGFLTDKIFLKEEGGDGPKKHSLVVNSWIAWIFHLILNFFSLYLNLKLILLEPTYFMMLS